MNIFYFLKGCSGKMKLSTAKTIGLAVALGIAGIAIWQACSSPKEVNPDVAFSAAGEPEIVYVAAGNSSASYEGYGEGGEMISTVSYAKKARGMDLMPYQGPVEKRNVEPAAAVDVGTVEGLDQQEAAVNAFDLKDNPYKEQYEEMMKQKSELEKQAAQGGVDLQGFSLEGATADNMQDKIAELMAKAKQQAGAAGQDISAEDQARMQAEAERVLKESLGVSGAGSGHAGSDKWGMAEGIARAKGHNLNATPLQSSVDGSQRSGTLGGADGALKGISVEIDSIAPKFEGGRESVTRAGLAFTSDKTMEGIRKRSAEVAGSRTHSANEGARAFLGADKMSGGLYLEGETSALELGETTDEFSKIPRPKIPSSLYRGGGGNEYLSARDELAEALENYAGNLSWISLGTAALRPFVAMGHAWAIYLVYKLAQEAEKNLKQIDEKTKDFLDHFDHWDAAYGTEKNTYGKNVQSILRPLFYEYQQSLLTGVAGVPYVHYLIAKATWEHEAKEAQDKEHANGNNADRTTQSTNPRGKSPNPDHLESE